ncbi:MAG: tail fiber domain-containing protein [Flavobacteriaceae bacterium]|nr:tail fiber domain-containing protein [Flavobacteriaceae bacterium]
MKKWLFFIGFLVFTVGGISQVGIGTTSPDASSILDISSTDKGILIPKVALADVTDTMLDGVNTAATGLLIYNTNAATTGGSGVGFYYFTGTVWERIITSATPTNDHDWYEESTTSSPNSINDNIYTMGNVAIGKNTTSWPLEIEEDQGGRGVSVVMNGSNNVTTYGLLSEVTSSASTASLVGVFGRVLSAGNGEQRGVHSLVNGNGTGIHYGALTELQGAGTGNQYGSGNNISNTGNGSHFGTYNLLSGTGVGTHQGVRNELSGTGTGTQVGTRNVISNTGDDFHWGVYNTLSGFGGGNQFGTHSSITNTGNGNHIGSYTELNGSGSGIHQGVRNELFGAGGGIQRGISTLISNTGFGTHLGVENTLSGTGSGDQYGTQNVISNSGNGVHYGTDNTFSGTGTGFHYGTVNRFSEGTGEHTGTYNVFSDNIGNGDLRGLMNLFSAGGNATVRGTHTEIKNTVSGNGDHYGSYFVNESSGIGEHYGNYNVLSGTGSGYNVGSYNWITNSGSGEHRGVSNRLFGAGSGDHFGIYNSLEGNGSGKNTGMHNFISNTGNGIHIGVQNSLLSSGTGAQYGTYTTIYGTGTGAHIGSYTYLFGTGGGNKIGYYSWMDPLAGGNHYGIFSDVQKAGSYAGFFVGRGYFSDFVGIGTTAPATSLHINHPLGATNGLSLSNSTDTDRWHFYVFGSNDLYLYFNNIARGNFDDVTGNYTAVSDRNLKSNIAKIDNVLERVKKLEVVDYTFKHQTNNERHLGLIAQDVEPLFPQLVKKPTFEKGEESPYMLNYSGFGIIAIKAIQEQQQIIENQQSKIESLEKQLDEVLEILKILKN